MSKLGIKKGTENEEGKKVGFLPAVLKPDEEISLTKAIAMSILGHAGFVLACWILSLIFVLIMAFLGISLDLFKKPEPKMRDIEFVLVKKEKPPINKKTKYRATKNSQAGGKHKPKKKVATPTPPAPKAKPKKKAAPQTPKNVVKPAPKPQVAKKQPTPPRPAPTASVPKPTMAPPNAFSVPIPKTKMPRTLNPGGPVSTAPLGTMKPTATPGPVVAQGSPGSSSKSSPYSLGSGSLGNPSPGNPNGEPGVDAIEEPDFGPYMRDVQMKIKRNWDPPKSNQSKRVVLVFTIAKDGRLLNVKISDSSGIPSVDKAAIAAIEYSAPFKPLPAGFKGSDIDIHFTFDYNVFGVNVGY